MPHGSSAYEEVAKSVQSAAVSSSSGKGGHKPHRRDFKGRVFPKASIRNLARKANVSRMAYGPSTDGVAEDSQKDTYGYVDRKVFAIMENVLYDAIAIANATKKSGKGKGCIIKERHVLKALHRYGGLGLGTADARRTMF
jgi:hypothetical protein